MSTIRSLCSPAYTSILCRFAVLAFLVFLGIGVSLGWAVGHVLEMFALDRMTEDVAKTLSPRIAKHLMVSDLAGPLSGQELDYFDNFVRENVLTDDAVKIKLWNSRGQVVYSTDRSLIGRVFPMEAALSAALGGTVARSVAELDKEENIDDNGFGRLLEIYAPVYLVGGGGPAGAFEVYRLYDPIHSSIQRQQRYLYGILGLGLLTVYGSLFWIVKEGSTTIARQRVEIQDQYNRLQEAYRAAMETLSSTLEIRNGDTEDHVARTSRLALSTGRAMGLSAESLSALERGACLHDVGKIGVPDAVLLKPGSLTEEEWMLMRKHPEMGSRLICQVPGFDRVAEVVLSHHERYDGAGYPRGLRGADIPVEARILAVVDAYDAMTNDRPYRKAMALEAASAELEANVGSQFDPAVVGAFVEVVLREVVAVPEPLAEAVA